MFYFLYKYFDINLFQYITVRAGIGFFIGIILTFMLMPSFINTSRNIKQPILKLTPSSHQAKLNTPTMGGLVFILTSIIGILITTDLTNHFVIDSLIVMILFGAIGIKDDLNKVANNKNETGLSPKIKFLLQIIAGFVVVGYLFLTTDISSSLYVPFYKHPVLDMNFFSIIFWTVVIISTSNAVNLTDGLDGLATVPSILSISTLSVLIYIIGNAVWSEYLLLPNIYGVGEVSVVGAIMVGSLIGFLWYNCHPAEVFMGDSGSLSIGALIGYMGVISKNEILLIFIGAVFVVETVSVLIQVGSFKTRKKRIFLMAPIHHHFEIKGWNESKIIVRFWILALLSNIVALLTIKLR